MEKFKTKKEALANLKIDLKNTNTEREFFFNKMVIFFNRKDGKMTDEYLRKYHSACRKCELIKKRINYFLSLEEKTNDSF